MATDVSTATHHKLCFQIKGIRDAGSTADFRILFEIFEILEIIDFSETLKFFEIFEILTLLHFYTVTLFTFTL